MIIELIERLAREAARHEMDFLVIGGQAMNHLGYQRFTLDVDFMGSESTRNQWEEIMRSYGYALAVRTPALDQYTHQTPGWPQVDIMFVNDGTWQVMRSEAGEKQSGRITIRVPSPRHMVALKLHAAKSPQRTDPAKDWADIHALVQAHALDVSDPAFLDLVVRHGGTEALEKLKKPAA